MNITNLFFPYTSSSNSGSPQLSYVTSSAQLRVSSPSSIRYLPSLSYRITHHQCGYPVQGFISGSNGGTTRLVLFDTATGEGLRTHTVTGDGPYTMSWFDSSRTIAVSGYASSTSKGVSTQGRAGINTFDILLSQSFSSTGGGGYSEYWS